MRKITIDADEWIKDMTDGMYKFVNTEYTRGCNDVLKYYIKKLEQAAKENVNETTL